MPVFGLAPRHGRISCGSPRRRASTPTDLASAREPGRRPWSTVATTRSEPRARRRRHRWASTMRAVESAPPDTARITRPERGNDANSSAISRSEIAAASAMDTLLFPLDRLPDAQRGAGIFAADLRERAAGGVLLAHLREGLAEPQQRVGGLGGRGVIARNEQKQLGGVGIFVALKQGLAQPVIRVRRARIARVLLEETAKTLLGKFVILAQHVTISEVELVARGRGGRERRQPAAGGIGIARRRRRQRTSGRRRRTGGRGGGRVGRGGGGGGPPGRPGRSRQIERAARRPRRGRAGRCGRGERAERPRRAGR